MGLPLPQNGEVMGEVGIVKMTHETHFNLPHHAF